MDEESKRQRERKIMGERDERVKRAERRKRELPGTAGFG